MGRKFDEVHERKRRACPTRSCARENGDAWVEARGKKYSPPEISAMVLQKLKQAAEDYLGEKVTDAVITVPAYFNDAQRQATKDAGKIAGLNVLRIINEPTAAALAYGLDKKKDETIAVYDFGGGTFDISVLEVGEGVVEVKATNGDTHLGGDDLDDRIIDWLAAEFKKSEGIDLSKDRMALQRLKEGAEKAKIELSTAMETEINLPFVTADQTGPKHLQVKLTRAKLEQLVDDLLQRTMAPVKQALADAGRRPDEDRRGGARRRLDAHAEGPAAGARVLRQGPAQGREPGRSRRDRRGGPGRRPDRRSQGHAAARRDAAVARHRDARRRDDHAHHAQHDDSDAEERDRSRRRPTTRPTSKCTCCRASVRWRATTARSAGSSWSGLPPAPRGVPQIEVAFDIDANGIVNVAAKDMATGKEQKITISGSSGLSKDDVDRMVKDAQSHAADDQARRDLIDARNQADSLAYQVEKTVNENREKVPVGELSKVEAAIADVRQGGAGRRPGGDQDGDRRAAARVARDGGAALQAGLRVTRRRLRARTVHELEREGRRSRRRGVRGDRKHGRAGQVGGEVQSTPTCRLTSSDSVTNMEESS